MAEKNVTDELDLLGEVCQELTIETVESDWISVSPDADEQITGEMRRMPNVQWDEIEGLSVDYMDILARPPGCVRLHGSLLRFEEEGEARYGLYVSFTAFDEPYGPPPREEFVPFKKLLDLTGEHFGEVLVSCSARFVYQLDETRISRVRIPSPLLFAVGLDSALGFTHVENVTLSRRTKKGVSHTVRVEQGDDAKSMIHTVRLEITGPITWGSLETLRGFTEHLSGMLLESRRPQTT